MEPRDAMVGAVRVRAAAGRAIFFEPSVFDLFQREFLAEQSGSGGVQAGDHAAAGLRRVPVDRIFQRGMELGAAAGDDVAGSVLGPRGAAVRAVVFAL